MHVCMYVCIPLTKNVSMFSSPPLCIGHACAVARSRTSFVFAAGSSHRTIMMDFRGFASSIISILRGGILMSIGNFPGMFESSNLSRDNASREIGRTELRVASRGQRARGCKNEARVASKLR